MCARRGIFRAIQFSMNRSAPSGAQTIIVTRDFPPVNTKSRVLLIFVPGFKEDRLNPRPSSLNKQACVCTMSCLPCQVQDCPNSSKLPKTALLQRFLPPFSPVRTAEDSLTSHPLPQAAEMRHSPVCCRKNKHCQQNIPKEHRNQVQ